MSDIQSEVKEIKEILEGHIKQYDLDMRGDTDLTNGNKGLINEFRKVRKYLSDYPSLLWLLTHRPARTVGSIFVVLTIYQVLWYIGIVNALASVMGVDVSVLTELVQQTVTP